jgi:HSP20 family protein
MFDLIPINRRVNRLARSAFDDMSDFMSDFFNGFFNNFAYPFTGNFMRSDVKDNGKEYAIDIELPGVKKEDIDVHLDNGYLTVAVNVKEENKDKKDNYIMQERRYGACQRSFRVSDNIKKSDIKAQYKDGILTLTLPKAEDTKEKDTRILIS